MQELPEMAGRLEEFRTETLGKHLPAEKKDVEVNSYMDNLLDMDNFQIPEVPLVNSRAGLYIYLSAAVSLLGFARTYWFMLTVSSSWAGPWLTIAPYLHTYKTDTR